MKTMTIEMPEVNSCSATGCAYNVEKSCRAKAITVGDERAPQCDTFFSGSPHARATTRVSGVGACKMTSCRHNQDLECSADSISVGWVGDQVRCQAYSAARKTTAA